MSIREDGPWGSSFVMTESGVYSRILCPTGKIDLGAAHYTPCNFVITKVMGLCWNTMSVQLCPEDEILVCHWGAESHVQKLGFILPFSPLSSSSNCSSFFKEIWLWGMVCSSQNSASHQTSSLPPPPAPYSSSSSFFLLFLLLLFIPLLHCVFREGRPMDSSSSLCLLLSSSTALVPSLFNLLGDSAKLVC